ncbi:MAG TPA: heme-binding domain-containing protein [Pyrinomonadaceae bacterium]|nr:heme-binding domain-containing protein [Pyrinomonadaceae bacterium]
MKKILKVTLIVLAAAVIIAQFIQPDRTNPPVNAAETLEASAAVPDDVKNVLSRACADCHTSNTSYPWYSKVSPVSWWMQNHINEGRHELNFSQWATFSDKRKNRKLDEICEQVRSREMPLPSYLWIHRDSKLSDDEINLLCSWTESMRPAAPE